MMLLVDMNLSPRWIATLRSHGIAAEHWSDIGPVNASDRDILAIAAQREMVVLTNDLDFGAILAASGLRSPSVIQLRTTDLRPEAAAEAVALAMTVCAQELATGALLTVDAARWRVTLLPLRT